jgi:PiT family inorganic phosphate transporter
VIKNVTAPAWVVLIGAIGLVIGLATYGYKASDTGSCITRTSRSSPTAGSMVTLVTTHITVVHGLAYLV